MVYSIFLVIVFWYFFATNTWLKICLTFASLCAWKLRRIWRGCDGQKNQWHREAAVRPHKGHREAVQRPHEGHREAVLRPHEDERD